VLHSRGMTFSSTSTEPTVRAWVSSTTALGGFCEGLVPVKLALASRPTGLVIDVGSFDGADAVSFAIAGHEVITVEPAPGKRKGILANIARTGLARNVTFLAAAVSSQPGNVTFTIFAKGSKQSQSDQIRPPWVNVSRKDAPVWMDPTHAREVSVPSTTLDLIAGDRRVLYTKIDAQGHDGAVVLGARRLIRSRRLRFLSMEVSPKLSSEPHEYVEALRLLQKHGYDCMDCSKFWAPHPSVWSVRQADWRPQLQVRSVESRLAEITNTPPCNGMLGGCWTNIACAAPGEGT